MEASCGERKQSHSCAAVRVAHRAGAEEAELVLVSSRHDVEQPSVAATMSRMESTRREGSSLKEAARALREVQRQDKAVARAMRIARREAARQCEELATRCARALSQRELAIIVAAAQQKARSRRRAVHALPFSQAARAT